MYVFYDVMCMLSCILCNVYDVVCIMPCVYVQEIDEDNNTKPPLISFVYDMCMCIKYYVFRRPPRALTLYLL